MSYTIPDELFPRDVAEYALLADSSHLRWLAKSYLRVLDELAEFEARRDALRERLNLQSEVYDEN